MTQVPERPSLLSAPEAGQGPPSPGGRPPDPTGATMMAPAQTSAALSGLRAPASGPPDGRGFGGLPLPIRLVAIGGLVISGLVVAALGLRDRQELLALEGAAGAPAGGAAAPAGELRAAAKRDLVAAAELDAAKAKGAPALEALAGEYPKDPAVRKALMLARPEGPTGQAAALSDCRKLLELRPEASGDAEVQRFLRRAAEGPAATSDEALKILATRMGTAGPDVIHELSSSRAPGLKSRASKLLEDRKLRAAASPALRVALELGDAPGCKDKRALLGRAAEHGDERALEILRPLVKPAPRGCGFLGLGACPPPCASIAADVRRAIASIEARLEGQKDAGAR